MIRNLMIKSLMIFVILSCSKKEPQQTTNSIDDIIARNEFYIKNVDETALFPERCDHFTFASSWKAYGNNDYDMSVFKYGDCLYNRDANLCYETGDSRSPISSDGYITIADASLVLNDTKTIEEIVEYGNEHAWTMCDYGPKEYTNIIQLAPLFYSIENYMDDLRFKADDYGIIPTGFRGHLLAMYIKASSNAHGSLRERHRLVLKDIVENDEKNLIAFAIYHQYTDGIQDYVINEMNKHYSENLSYETGSFGWGSAPDIVYHAILTSILKGD